MHTLNESLTQTLRLKVQLDTFRNSKQLQWETHHHSVQTTTINTTPPTQNPKPLPILPSKVHHQSSTDLTNIVNLWLTARQVKIRKAPQTVPRWADARATVAREMASACLCCLGKTRQCSTSDGTMVTVRKRKTPGIPSDIDCLSAFLPVAYRVAVDDISTTTLRGLVRHYDMAGSYSTSTAPVCCALHSAVLLSLETHIAATFARAVEVFHPTSVFRECHKYKANGGIVKLDPNWLSLYCAICLFFPRPSKMFCRTVD